MIKYLLLQDKSWLQERVNNQPLRQIAKEVGCSYSGVLYATRKLKISIPPRTRHRYNPNKSQAVKRSLQTRYPNGRFGDQASNWRGGRSKHNGYWTVYIRNHPRGGRRNRVFEHILIAERSLNRYLTRDEVVHHLNGDKLDNRPDNLQVMKRSEHVGYHLKSGKNIQEMLTKLEVYEKKYGPLP